MPRGTDFTVCNDNSEACINYCSKELTRDTDDNIQGPMGPWWFPDEQAVRGVRGQGSRSDLEGAIDTLKQHGMKRVIQDHPEIYVKFGRGMKDLAQQLKPKYVAAPFEPRIWQKKLVAFLNTEADNRTIVYITDKAGNCGKSTMAMHAVDHMGAVQLGGKVNDMAYQYDDEPIVMFDVTRSMADNTRHLYQFAEQLKNGYLNSNKYECQVKRFKPPHVVFFSNVEWNKEGWTNDRVLELDSTNSSFNQNTWFDYPARMHETLVEELELPVTEIAQQHIFMGLQGEEPAHAFM